MFFYYNIKVKIINISIGERWSQLKKPTLELDSCNNEAFNCDRKCYIKYYKFLL